MRAEETCGSLPGYSAIMHFDGTGWCRRARGHPGPRRKHSGSTINYELRIKNYEFHYQFLIPHSSKSFAIISLPSATQAPFSAVASSRREGMPGLRES